MVCANEQVANSCLSLSWENLSLNIMAGMFALFLFIISVTNVFLFQIRVR